MRLSRTGLARFGAEFSDFLQSGTGAIERSVQDKLRESVSVKDFGVITGTVDDTPVAQKAVDSVAGTGGAVRFPRGTALIADLLVPSNVVLVGEGRSSVLKLPNGANTNVVKTVLGATDIGVINLAIDGNRANQTGGAIAAQIRGIRLDNSVASPSRRVMISGCWIYDVMVDAIMTWARFEDLIITNNFIDGVNWNALISLNSPALAVGFSKNAVIANNVLRNAQAAHIGWGGCIHNAVIANNVCDTNNAGVGYAGGGHTADSIVGYDAGNDLIHVANNIVQQALCNNGIHMGGGRVSIVDNSVDVSRFAGIVISSQAGQPTPDAIIRGNRVKSSGTSGIWAVGCSDGIIDGNLVDTSTGIGVVVQPATTGEGDNIQITRNKISGSGSDGMRLAGITGHGNNDGLIQGNVIRNNTGSGINITDAGTGNTGNIIALNRITGNGGWGILEQNNAAENLFALNHLRGNTTGGATVRAASRMIEGWGNVQGADGVADFTAQPGMTVPADAGEFIKITSASAQTVTSINPVWAGRRLTIHLGDSNTTFGHAGGAATGQFYLDGGTNKTTTLRDIISFVSDGTNWFQAAPVMANG